VQKLSAEKISWPGKKQVFRRWDDQQQRLGDILGLRGEIFADSEPLLEKVMENGRPLKSPTLASSREKFLEEFHRLDDAVKAVRDPAAYPLEYSDSLRKLQRQVSETIKQQGAS